MERQTVTAESVRAAIKVLSENNQPVSHKLICNFMGLEVEAEKDVARKYVTSMCRRGEVKRLERGLFLYDFHRPRPRDSKSTEIVWRFVRKAKPGWTLTECSLMTHVSYTHILRYSRFLEEEGYISREGRDSKQAITYRATLKADQHPETPYPSIRETDPFHKERVAVANLTRLMLCADPYARHTARQIVEACQVLLARFNKNSTENENEEIGHVE